MQQIEQQEFTNRPGYAKRAVRQIPTIKPLQIQDPKDLKGLCGYQVQKAIALGLPDLPAQERDLLQFYAAFLNIAAVKEGKTSVWPSNRIACQLLGISEASLRRYKASLEHKGYIVRHYDQRNRPLERGAIDLAPLLCQVEGLLTSVGKVFAYQRRYYEDQRQMDYKNSPSFISAHPLNRERQKQRKSNFSLTVPETDLLEAEASEERGGNVASISSEMFEVIGYSPKLLKHIDDEMIQAETVGETWVALDAAVLSLFPNHNTATHSWTRAKQRYGEQAIALLVVCLEDSSIKDGGKFLGYMAHQWQGKINLKPNLRRISDAIAIMDKKMARDQEVAVLKERMPLLVKAGIPESEIGSWFRQAEITETEGQLTVTLPNSFIASRVRENYLSLLLKASLKPVYIKRNVVQN